MDKEALKMEMDRLRDENKALKETCEVLFDKNVMKDIKKSLEEIKNGKSRSLSELQ